MLPIAPYTTIAKTIYPPGSERTNNDIEQSLGGVLSRVQLAPAIYPSYSTLPAIYDASKSEIVPLRVFKNIPSSVFGGGGYTVYRCLGFKNYSALKNVHLYVQDQYPNSGDWSVEYQLATIIDPDSGETARTADETVNPGGVFTSPTLGSPLVIGDLDVSSVFQVWMKLNVTGAQAKVPWLGASFAIGADSAYGNNDPYQPSVYPFWMHYLSNVYVADITVSQPKDKIFVGQTRKITVRVRDNSTDTLSDPSGNLMHLHVSSTNYWNAKKEETILRITRKASRDSAGVYSSQFTFDSPGHYEVTADVGESRAYASFDVVSA